MIKKASQIRHNDEVNLKGGKGTLEIINFLEKEESCGTGRLFAVSIIPPGCSIGYHKHQGDFETYYFLKGKAKVVDEGKEDILGPGDCMVCYDGRSHGIENIGDTNLEYIAIILYTPK
jgi:mannose-6-phosphate isomerase-like protein (cupin superfamily)